MAWLDAQEDGDFYLFVRRYDKAEQAFQLAAKEAKAFGRNDPRGARSLTGLARVALAKRDFKGAAASFQEALSIKRKAYGNYNSDVSDLMTELARAQVMQGNVGEARKLIDEATSIKKKIKDENTLPESSFVDALISKREGDMREANWNYKMAADGFLHKLKSLSYPTSTLTMQNGVDAVHAYSNFLREQRKETDVAAIYDAEIAPVEKWLSELAAPATE